MASPWDKFEEVNTSDVGDPSTSAVPYARPDAGVPAPASNGGGVSEFDQFQPAPPPLPVDQVNMPTNIGATDNPDTGEMTQARFRMSDQDQAEFLRRLNGGAQYGELVKFLADRHFGPGNLETILQARDSGQPYANDHIGFKLPPPRTDPGTAGAVLKSSLDMVSLGTADPIGAGIDTLMGRGNGDTMADRYNSNMDQIRADSEAMSENHPTAVMAGTIAGALFPMTSVEKIAAQAGKEILRNGGTMAEARAAAAAAATTHMTKVGGVQGAVYGTANTDGGVGDKLAGGFMGAVAGMAGGAGVGKVGEAVAPRLAARAAAARAAPDYAAIAERLGIEPTPATTGGGVAQSTQMAFGNLPGAQSVVAKAVDRENQGLADAAGRVAASMGNATTRDAAGAAVASGAKAYERATSAEGGALYRARDATFGGADSPVLVSETQKAFDDLQSRFPNSPEIARFTEHPALRKLSASLPGQGELTLAESTEALSWIRGVKRSLSAKQDTPSPILSRVATIEKALEGDVMNAARAADQRRGVIGGGQGSAVAAQIEADKFWANRSRVLNGSLKTALRSANDDIKQSGESVYNQLVANMQAKGGNLRRVVDAWRNLPANARSTFAATAFDDLGRATSGAQNDLGTAWSFNTFLTNFDKLHPAARKIVFGKGAEPEIRDIAAYASRLRDLNKSRNFSNTAKHLISGSIMTAMGGALFHGNVAGAAEIAGATAASIPAAKLFLSTPAMRAWTRSAMRVALTPASPRQSANAGKLLTRLTAISKAEPAIAEEVLHLRERLVEALSPARASVAANEGSNPSTGVIVSQQPQGDQNPKRKP